jgi:hypothetical protein
VGLQQSGSGLVMNTEALQALAGLKAELEAELDAANAAEAVVLLVDEEQPDPWGAPYIYGCVQEMQKAAS